MTPDLKRILPDILSVAHDAGKRILELYGAAAEWKEDRSPITAADRASHDLITGELERLTPDLPVLSEEGAGIPYEERRAWKAFWLVDPLDGTKEFIKRSGEFTVNIALVEDGRPILGVVHTPALGLTHFATRDGDAFELCEGRERTITCRRAGDPPTLVVSRDHMGDREREIMALFEGAEAISMGSALKFCLVAEGRADLYPRFVPTMEWDTAAAQIVVERAGGRVTEVDGRPLVYNKESLRNPSILTWADATLFERVRLAG